MYVTVILSWAICSSILISVANGNLPNKIYGGKTVPIGDHSYQVSVQFQDHHICGGAIISSFYILTTASCMLADRYAVYGNIQVLTGSNSLIKDYGENVNWKIYPVAYVIFHAEYNPRINWINDIGILKLATELHFNVDCYQVSSPLNHMSLTAISFTGWGRNPVTNIMTKYLQKIDVRSIKNSVCNVKYFKDTYMSKTQYCLFPRRKTARITQGNSGSPILSRSKMIGIVSVISLNLRYPAIYTRVYNYMNWLREIFQKL